jgi:hypothetical protein
MCPVSALSGGGSSTKNVHRNRYHRHRRLAGPIRLLRPAALSIWMSTPVWMAVLHGRSVAASRRRATSATVGRGPGRGWSPLRRRRAAERVDCAAGCRFRSRHEAMLGANRFHRCRRHRNSWRPTLLPGPAQTHGAKSNALPAIIDGRRAPPASRSRSFLSLAPTAVSDNRRGARQAVLWNVDGGVGWGVCLGQTPLRPRCSRRSGRACGRRVPDLNRLKRGLFQSF